jgi:hypothetical protein
MSILPDDCRFRRFHGVFDGVRGLGHGLANLGLLGQNRGGHRAAQHAEAKSPRKAFDCHIFHHLSGLVSPFFLKKSCHYLQLFDIIKGKEAVRASPPMEARR